MSLLKLEKLSSKIVAIGGAITVIGGIIAYFGFEILTPTAKLQKHIEREQSYHQSLDSLARHTDEHLEGLLRGECIENPRENLARQGLLGKCKELGIEK